VIKLICEIIDYIKVKKWVCRSRVFLKVFWVSVWKSKLAHKQYKKHWRYCSREWCKTWWSRNKTYHQLCEGM